MSEGQVIRKSSEMFRSLQRLANMNVLTSKTAVGCRLANACFKRSFYLYSPEPFHPLSDRVPEYKSAEEAVQVIQSGEPTILRNCGAFITDNGHQTNGHISQI